MRQSENILLKMAETILILGACGQIGTELSQSLREIHGRDKVIASDIRYGEDTFVKEGPFEIIDATDRDTIVKVIQKHNVSQVYLMAAMLSATAEKHPQKAWDLNMNSLLIILELAKEKLIDTIYWPSSIAVFGPSSPKVNTPQDTIMNPTTVYGMSKLAGEHWCNYYHNKFGVDVRSLRYPGIISWKTKPGGGTTDYAVDIYFKAVEEGKYECFLEENTMLPMMYMKDAIDATINIMEAKSEDIKVRTSYNLAAISFTPEQITAEIKKHIENFEVSYKPDFRQDIANSWPQIIDDSKAREDWNWSHEFDLESMTKEMLKNIQSSMISM
ncbi:nucleoside-diphosphate-sugar epimerase [Tenacibaculum skagerrakense]|uniref:Nucleoside-diphosphate-sugar epimerase n=2 Tax=Tenacibaculum skagerrakense TaxID=186571 RepID=A0A4R2NUG8_9FLAO|nr:nucleoside-diphosphate-sugar epimerase [Tenacibaculum skagerrakense]